tara:strand:- start:150 stop:854 length:705 start_codon:yes stop_codon:yes gene_type:complete
MPTTQVPEKAVAEDILVSQAVMQVSEALAVGVLIHGQVIGLLEGQEASGILTGVRVQMDQQQVIWVAEAGVLMLLQLQAMVQTTELSKVFHSHQLRPVLQVGIFHLPLRPSNQQMHNQLLVARLVVMVAEVVEVNTQAMVITQMVETVEIMVLVEAVQLILGKGEMASLAIRSFMFFLQIPSMPECLVVKEEVVLEAVEILMEDHEERAVVVLQEFLHLRLEWVMALVATVVLV